MYALSNMEWVARRWFGIALALPNLPPSAMTFQMKIDFLNKKWKRQKAENLSDIFLWREILAEWVSHNKVEHNWNVLIKSMYAVDPVLGASAEEIYKKNYSS